MKYQGVNEENEMCTDKVMHLQLTVIYLCHSLSHLLQTINHPGNGNGHPGISSRPPPPNYWAIQEQPGSFILW